MKHLAPTAIVSLSLALLAAGVRAQSSSATDAFERLKGLEGDWIDVDGILGPKGGGRNISGWHAR